MPDQNPLSGKVGLDTSEFKAGITALNREIRVIESGFRATAAGLGDWSKTSEGLEQRMKALTGQIEIQQKKVEATRQAYEKMAAEKGANSRAAQELEITLNKENERLGKMQNELNQTETELGQLNTSTTQAAGGMNKLEQETGQTTNRMETFKAVSAGMGVAIKGLAVGLAAVAGVAAAAAAGIASMVIKTAKSADEIGELAVKTGISTDALQELKYIGGQVGTDLDSMTTSMAKLVRSMAAAGDSPAGKAFTELGVATKDANGNLRDNQAVFADTLTALGKVQNETERDALAMQIFGKSAQELNPLIALGGAGMAAMAAEAHKLGAVMSAENIQAAGDLNDKIDGLKLGFQGIVMTMASALVPGLTQTANAAAGMAQRLAGAIGDFDKAPEAAIAVISGLVQEIVAQIPKLLQAGLKIVQGLLSGLMTALPALLPAAIQIVTSLMTFIVQSLPMLIQAASQIVLTLVQTIVPMLPALVEAGVQVLVQLINGISQMLPQLMPVLMDVIAKIIEVLVTNAPLLIQASLGLMTALVQGLILAIPVLVAAIPQIVQAIVGALITAGPILLQAGMDLLAMIALGISQALPGLITTSQQILTLIQMALEEKMTAMLQVGKAIVQGVWAGIQSKSKEFYQMVTNFFVAIVDKVKAALKISSPSKVFADIGANMALGVGVGFAAKISQVEKNIAQAMGGLNGLEAGAAGVGGGGGMGFNSSTVYNFGPVYYGSDGSSGGNSSGQQGLRY